MSEEEKKAIKFMRQWHNYAEIKTLLDLIEKQNNRLEQLEKENEELRRLDRTRVIGNINAIKIEDLKDVLSPYYVPKSVIREKIEEIKAKTISSKDDNKIGDYLVDTIKTLALKELLD